MTAALTIYTIGIAIALWRTDARWPTRIALALLWPVGPLAFLVTITILVAAAMIAFPVFGILVAIAALVVWLLI